MGCDVHMYVERRAGPGHPWVSADRWTESKYESKSFEVEYHDRVYSDRSYDLFSVLADVRNGHGFAGVKTGAGYVPISKPKGLPSDVSSEVAAASSRWDGDGHSHSWLTVAEILAYDWTQTTVKTGYVDVLGWAQWWGRGPGKRVTPESWSGDVGGGSVTHHRPFNFQEAWDRAARRLGKGDAGGPPHVLRWLSADGVKARELVVEELGGGSPYTQVEWTVPYYELAGQALLGEVLPKLLVMGGHGDVRLVFWFDN